MECMNCGIEYEAKRASSRYCSAKCRVSANRVSVTNEPEVSVTNVSVTGTITDATGNVHQIDYEGRRTNAKLLESWAKGEGTRGQRGLGKLAIQYSVINGFRDKDYKLTAHGHKYLAHKLTIAMLLEAKRAMDAEYRVAGTIAPQHDRANTSPRTNGEATTKP